MFAEAYQEGFVNYWSGVFGKADNIVMFALLLGLLCIALIALSGKWRK